MNMNSERGACCDWYEKRQAQWKARMKVYYVFLEGNPRLWVMLHRILRRSGVSSEEISLFMDDKPCPCMEAPDPKLFREFFGVLQAKKGQVEAENDEERLLKISSIAETFLKEKGVDLDGMRVR